MVILCWNFYLKIETKKPLNFKIIQIEYFLKLNYNILFRK